MAAWFRAKYREGGRMSKSHHGKEAHYGATAELCIRCSCLVREPGQSPDAARTIGVRKPRGDSSPRDEPETNRLVTASVP
jgi:hypothetical protein